MGQTPTFCLRRVTLSLQVKVCVPKYKAIQICVRARWTSVRLVRDGAQRDDGFAHSASFRNKLCGMYCSNEASHSSDRCLRSETCISPEYSRFYVSMHGTCGRVSADDSPLKLYWKRMHVTLELLSLAAAPQVDQAVAGRAKAVFYFFLALQLAVVI